MKKLIQATLKAAQDSESKAAIQTAKRTRIFAKRASNYIFYGADNAPVEKDTICSRLDEFIRISSESKMTGALMFLKKYESIFKI